MKPAPLLLFFPLLFPVHVLAARPLAKPELRADGRYQFQDSGRKGKFRIANDELHKTGPGVNRRIHVSAKNHLRKMQDDAKRLSSFEETVQLVAYEEGKPQTEQNRRLVTNKVSVTLDEGIDPTTIGLAVKALAMRDFEYAPRNYVMEFADAAEALTAAEALKAVPGVMRCSALLAKKREHFLIPDDPLFSNPSGAYANWILRDLADVRAVVPNINSFVIAQRNNGPVVQWYLNKQAGINVGMLPGLATASYTEKELPSFVDPTPDGIYTKYFDRPIDLNVIPAWDQVSPGGSPIDGTGVRVAVIDDGVQLNHPDLNQLRIDKQNDYNFLDGNPAVATDSRNLDPTPPFSAAASNNHGTAVAGLILANRGNNRGISGIAPDATLLAYRFIGGYVDPAFEGDVMVWGSAVIAPQMTPDNPFGLRNGTEWRRLQPHFHVANNSWGKSANGGALMGEDAYFLKALAYGIREGRNGKGIVYVFAAGNDGEYHADVNHRTTTNSIYTITVGGISDLGRRISYSSYGAALHCVAPTGGNEMAPRILHRSTANLLIPPFPPVRPDKETERAMGWTLSPDDWDHPDADLRSTQQIVTLDVPKTSATAQGGYNNNFDGTSASAPMVTGVVALMLEANPNLGWRDVQEIVMRCSSVVDPMYGEWSYNAMGMPMSHKYGAGLIDANRAVKMAKVWVNLGPRFGSEGGLAGTLPYREVKGDMRVLPANQLIQDNSFSSTNKSVVTISVPAPSADFRVEHVVVRVKIRHGRRGDLGIVLTSPAAGQAEQPVESFLFVPHREDFNANIGEPDLADSGGDRGIEEGEYWDFSTVRHWGTATHQNAPYDPTSTEGGGDWTLKIWDNTNQGIVATANPADADPQKRIKVDVANPTTQGRVEYAAVIYHGSTTRSGNEPPEIEDTTYLGRAGAPYSARIRAITDLTMIPEGDTLVPRAPIESYRVRVLKGLSVNAPDLVINSFGTAISSHLKFDQLTGQFTEGTTPLPKGKWQLEVRATNIFGTTRRLVTMEFRDVLTLQQWKELKFTPEQLANSRISGNDADPDGDGVPNLMEYAMGGEPLVAEPFLTPVWRREGDNFVYNFQVDTGAQRFTARPQISTDLVNWTALNLPTDSSNPTAALTETDSSGFLSFRRVTIPISSGPRLFIRLKVAEHSPSP